MSLYFMRDPAVFRGIWVTIIRKANLTVLNLFAIDSFFVPMRTNVLFLIRQNLREIEGKKITTFCGRSK